MHKLQKAAPSQAIVSQHLLVGIASSAAALMTGVPCPQDVYQSIVAGHGHEPGQFFVWVLFVCSVPAEGIYCETQYLARYTQPYTSYLMCASVATEGKQEQGGLNSSSSCMKGKDRGKMTGQGQSQGLGHEKGFGLQTCDGICIGVRGWD